jgi:hypothetical protein
MNSKILVHIESAPITQLLIPTHAHFHWLKFIKTSKKLLHVSVYDHHQGVTMSLPMSLLFNHSCMYAKCGGVAAYHIVCIGLCLRSVPGVRVLASTVDDHSTSKNTHTRDAPQAQTDPNNMICCHTTTTLSIHTTVVK